jgi:hypothetical protein
MKIRLFLTAIALSAATFSFAQTDNTVNKSDQVRTEAMELTEEMTTYLDLNEAQVERMKGLNMGLMKKKAELQSMELTDAEKANKINEFEERHNATVKQVLSDEQYEKFKKKYGEIKMDKMEKSKK